MPDPFPPPRTRVFEPPEPITPWQLEINNENLVNQHFAPELAALKKDPAIRDAAIAYVEAKRTNLEFRRHLVDTRSREAKANMPMEINEKAVMSWVPTANDFPLEAIPANPPSIYITPEESERVGKLFQEEAAASKKLEATIQANLEKAGLLEKIRTTATKVGYGVTVEGAIDAFNRLVEQTIEREVPQPIVPGEMLKPTTLPVMPSREMGKYPRGPGYS